MKGLFKYFGLGGFISGIFGAVNDLFVPIIETPHVAWKASLILLAVMICCLLPPIDRKIRRYAINNDDAFAVFIKDYWAKSILGFVFLVSIGTFVLANVTMLNEKEGGYLAKNSVVMADIQAGWAESLNVDINIIKRDVKAIKQTTQAISRKSDSLLKGQKITHNKLDKVKKETSDNPRKELANMGILWDDDNFAKAIRQRDFQTVELFIKGGMNIQVYTARKPITNLIRYGPEDDVLHFLSILVKNKLSLNKKFDNSESPLASAVEKDRWDIVEYLEKHGAKIGDEFPFVVAGAILDDEIGRIKYFLKKGVDTTKALKDLKKFKKTAEYCLFPPENESDAEKFVRSTRCFSELFNEKDEYDRILEVEKMFDNYRS